MGAGFTAEKMKKAVSLKPEAVAQIEFLEMDRVGHLRHTKFVGLWEDKAPRRVTRERKSYLIG
jgi:ATP-dependent DNA ligase